MKFSRGTRVLGAACLAAALLGLAGGCAPGDIVGEPELPTDVPDPTELQTPAGALMMYHGTIGAFAHAFSDYVAASGLLTDELENGLQVGSPFSPSSGVDLRSLIEVSGSSGADDPHVSEAYVGLQRVRGQAAQAIGLLRDYAPNLSPALRGHVYALQGYSELLLAEFYCSGIPLSTVDYDGDYTFQPGSSTAEVLTHAVALFDTALALTADSARLRSLGQVGRARALLALGDLQGAAQQVQDVPELFRYELHYLLTGQPDDPNFAGMPTGQWSFTTTDREGVNGLDFRSSGDPRTAAVDIGVNEHAVSLFHPAKYNTEGTTPITLADGVEARLIEAEAALDAGQYDTWLAGLNGLRQQAPAINPAWPVLPDTTDPGPDGSGGDALRLDLTFRERAFWLYLTGHRQGDLRRLVRQYDRASQTVYPSGAYRSGAARYGNDVTVPIPAEEADYNPLYGGCIDRDA
jgi:starch-binding outer membrane protein, SusD/RagB family